MKVLCQTAFSDREDPQYLVLDEPMNGLDPAGMRWFRRFIRSQAEWGKPYSSHHTQDVQRVRDLSKKWKRGMLSSLIRGAIIALIIIAVLTILLFLLGDFRLVRFVCK